MPFVRKMNRTGNHAKQNNADSERQFYVFLIHMQNLHFYIHMS